jgi:sugar/nucleoside kinase (ribokinase family)
MYDLISIGSISIDLYFKGESLTFKDNRFQLAVGGKYVVDHFYESVGGSASNVAVGVGKFGLKPAVFGIVGNNPFKHIILNKLQQKNVSTNLCYYKDDYYNISAILLSQAGERSIIHYITPHQNLINDAVSINRLIETKIVYLGNLPEVSISERQEILHLYKKHGIMTVVNLGSQDCRRKKKQLENILTNTDILIVNGHEFADLVKAPYSDIHFKEDIVWWYIPNLAQKLVVVTEGSKGSYAYLNGKVYHQAAIKPAQIVDTTGAGDGYTAAFIAEYFKSKDIKKSMEKGAIYAAKILSKIGAN